MKLDTKKLILKRGVVVFYLLSNALFAYATPPRAASVRPASQQTPTCPSGQQIITITCPPPQTQEGPWTLPSSTINGTSWIWGSHGTTAPPGTPPAVWSSISLKIIRVDSGYNPLEVGCQDSDGVGYEIGLSITPISCTIGGAIYTPKRGWQSCNPTTTTDCSITCCYSP